MADSMVARYLQAKERATARGDWNLARECDFQLSRLGYKPETAVAAPASEDTAVPRRGPGRPRKETPPEAA